MQCVQAFRSSCKISGWETWIRKKLYYRVIGTWIFQFDLSKLKWLSAYSKQKLSSANQSWDVAVTKIEIQFEMNRTLLWSIFIIHCSNFILFCSHYMPAWRYQWNVCHHRARCDKTVKKWIKLQKIWSKIFSIFSIVTERQGCQHPPVHPKRDCGLAFSWKAT